MRLQGSRGRRRRLRSSIVPVMSAACVAVGIAAIGTPASGARHAGAAAASHASSSACPTYKAAALGAPVWTLGCHIGGQGFTSPVVGTIDGVKVVVDASLTGMVYVVNARTGREMPGWPEAATLVGGTRTAIDSSPAIAYLDGPAKPPSIVVGLGSLYVKDQNGGVMAWNSNGRVRFRFLTRRTFNEWGGSADDWTNSVFATPAIGNIGNGEQDIVFGSYDHYVYALGPNGKLLPGFPINRADTIWSSPALADTTHTGVDDIIEGGDSTGWTGGGKTRCYSGWISDYRYVDSKPTLIWQHCLAETVWSSPAVGNFGSTPVVVVGTSWFYGASRPTLPAEDEVFAYNARTGALLPGWPVNTGGPTFGSPAITPLAAGGSDKVVETSCASCLSGPAIVSAWSETGKLIWRDHVADVEQLASPAVASITGSDTYDVLVGNDNGLYALDAANGDPVDGTGSTPIDDHCSTDGTPVVAPIPGSKTGYMLFSNCGVGVVNPTYDVVRAFNVPAPPTAEPWPMFRANAQRTGVPDPSSYLTRSCRAPKIPAGYRVATVGGGLYAFGTPYCGNLADRIIPGQVAGVAATPDGGGYWIALTDGSVYAFGDAESYGDLRTMHWQGGAPDDAPGAPIVGIAATASGKGYYLLAGDGSVYAFGNARFHGSKGGYRARGTPVAIASDDATGGYWIATSSGHVYAFGAPSLGSKTRHKAPIVGIAAAPSGNGYWLVSSTGTVYAFGSARNYGSVKAKDVVGIAAAPSGRGYYIATSTGLVYHKGDARYAGSAAHETRGVAVVGIATP